MELLLSTPGGRLLRERLLDGSLLGYATELALTEARYILCRRIGWEEAASRVEKLSLSGFIEVEDITPLCERASKLKCEAALSLPDCFTISLAEMLSIPALFARRERELLRELRRIKTEAEILFLEDFVEAGRTRG